MLKIKKGQGGFKIDFTSGLSPAVQKTIWESLYNSKKISMPEEYNPATTKLKPVNYLESSPIIGGAAQSKTGPKDGDDFMSSLIGIGKSIPEPTVQAITTGLAIAPQISGGIDSLGTSLGVESTTVQNAKGVDKVFNFMQKYNPAMKLGLTLGSAITGDGGKTKVQTDNSLTTGISGYDPTVGVDTQEISYGRDLLSGLWGAGKQALKTPYKKGDFINSLRGEATALATGGVKGLLNHKKEKLSPFMASTKTQQKAATIDYENLQKQQESKKAKTDLESAQSSYRNILNKNYQTLSGGRQFILARQGTKLFKIKNIKKAASKKSVIPDGKLHSRINEHDDGVTNKGIPVVSYENGKTIQHAEIEREELILNIDITKKLETLWKKYKDSEEDALLIEAGQLLADEILENTEDNVGLLEKVQ
jgi:hypothetical protein